MAEAESPDALPSPLYAVPRVSFNDGSATEFSAILNGCWTLAGGHGNFDKKDIIRVMGEHASHGLTTFDTADIYGPSERILGEFQESWRQADSPEVQLFTKYVPNIFNQKITPTTVRAAIQRSLSSLRVSSLDLVQLHWWDYSIPGLADVAKTLTELKEEGLIGSVGVTNMNTETLVSLVDQGVPIVSNQVQFSLLDPRPLRSSMIKFCKQNGIKLLTYGTVAGGLLSDRYVEPEPARGLFGRESYKKLPVLSTSSQKMYWRIVKEGGGEERWKRILTVASGIASKHRVSVAAVALRWAMDSGPVHPIVGMRNSSHIQDNLRVFSFSLDESERGALSAAALGEDGKGGPRGDCYDLERGMV